MLVTELTRRFGIDHPIVQAGMGTGAGARLAAAVSNAGALGTVGTITRTPSQVRREIEATRAATARPFAVNLVSFEWAVFAAAIVDAVIEAAPPAVTLSFGDPTPVLERCREAGIPTLVQVQDIAGFRAAIDGGADAVIVQGTEAGGHTGRRGTVSFVAQALAEAGEVPIVAAGGIGNGRGLAGMLAMGCAGSVMGSRFKATVEFEGDDGDKDQIVVSDGEDTVLDPINDIAFGLEWPNGVTMRVLRTRFTDEWLGRDEELRARVAEMPPLGFIFDLVANGTSINPAGESAALIDAIVPAAEIVERTVREAEELLTRVAALLRPTTTTPR
jgi:nitronate monooxygenase